MGTVCDLFDLIRVRERLDNRVSDCLMRDSDGMQISSTGCEDIMLRVHIAIADNSTAMLQLSSIRVDCVIGNQGHGVDNNSIVGHTPLSGIPRLTQYALIIQVVLHQLHTLS